jgi:hypothetical protein
MFYTYSRTRARAHTDAHTHTHTHTHTTHALKYRAACSNKSRDGIVLWQRTVFMKKQTYKRGEGHTAMPGERGGHLPGIIEV